MRNLTILREKSFVASMGTMKVYIEDPVNQELVIQGTPCRKLGTLANGKQKTFQIGDSQAKLYVIADKLSRNYANDFYEIPAGTEDISLSGKNHYNPGAGNPFYFNENNSAASLQNRKQGKKKGTAIIIVSVIIGLLLGIFMNMDKKTTYDPKVFNEAGITVTLTEEFKEFDAEGYTVGYTTRDCAMFALKEAFTLFENPEDITPQEYGQMVLDNSALDASVTLKEQDGLTYFEYQVEKYYYFAYIYKSGDAFWVVQFSCDKDNVDTFKADFMAWAKTITFQ